ncbi:MAG: hemerythrin family protein [Sulfuritalea sp.]|nr:hemerythrin family protein [Sulfuritalea sp.]
MAGIQWGLDFYTGLPEVDRQHQQLFALINRLGEAKSKQPEVIDRAFAELRDYVREHFALEEQLMAEAQVDAGHQAQHLAAHAGFAVRLNELWQARTDGSEFATDELLEFLTNWLMRHILHTDRNMALEIHTRMGTEAPHNMFEHF